MLTIETEQTTERLSIGCAATKVWFAARYAPESLQFPVAVGLILTGGLAIWLAESVRRRSVSRAQQTVALE